MPLTPNSTSPAATRGLARAARLPPCRKRAPGFVPEIGPAILLPDGRVFAIGATGATALYTPDPDPTIAGTWAGGPSLVDAHGNPSFPMDTPATLLPNGKVLLASAPGPPCNYPSPTTFFLYDPSTNTASVETSPSNGDGSPYGGQDAAASHWAGHVLRQPKGYEVYTPDAGGDASWKPAIINFPDTLIVGDTHTISGTQFNGLSQACSYGDDAQMATNYPIVQLKSGDKVYFLRTSNHSTMGVATGNATVSTNIFVPSNVQTGPASMIVIANGIASDPVSVTVGTRDSFFLLDRSTFSQGEIQALINLNGAPATISDAVFVVVEGFSKDQISGNAPSIPNPLAQISLQPAGPPIPQDPTLPSSAVQRFSFPFNIVFQDASVFGATSQTLTLNSAVQRGQLGSDGECSNRPAGHAQSVHLAWRRCGGWPVVSEHRSAGFPDRRGPNEIRRAGRHYRQRADRRDELHLDRDLEFEFRRRPRWDRCSMRSRKTKTLPR